MERKNKTGEGKKSKKRKRTQKEGVGGEGVLNLSFIYRK